MYDFSIEENKERCFNFKNNRPLWERDNLTRVRPQNLQELRSLELPNYPHDLEPL